MSPSVCPIRERDALLHHSAILQKAIAPFALIFCLTVADALEINHIYRGKTGHPLCTPEPQSPKHAQSLFVNYETHSLAVPPSGSLLGFIRR